MPTTNQSIIINKPINEVWERVRDFHDLSWAPAVISKVEKAGDLEGSQAGAKRILNDAFHETLMEIDDNNYLLRYSIDDGPSPVSSEEVSNYIGTLKLSNDQGSGGTLVEWGSEWDSNSDDAVEFCHGIYVALLGELEKSFSQ